ncbi:MAG: UDP-N-acetylmuramoyl-L-alanyl-D-glutamate--2,6-diaminopimelate ligase, partial [Bacteroidaceae bacterium]|nr:UDP-N-acetylmuramoyl-L-alanyl-D-glutamate--2,6-diaminopimelate ligase [Bacteroidaceae bacterium]
MRLNSLTRDIQFIQLILPKNETDITGINIDSRQVKKGDMFIAMRGTQVDGHKYIATAEEQGAAAIVCETLPEHINPEVAYLKVADSQAVAGKLATTFYGDPTQKLKLVGVTGTNGKTTIATLLYELFREMGHKCGLLSTVCNYINGTPYPST